MEYDTVHVIQANGKHYACIDDLVRYLESAMGEGQFRRKSLAINIKEFCYVLLRLKMED